MPSLTLYHQSYYMTNEFRFSSSVSKKVEKDIWHVFQSFLDASLEERFGVNIRRALYTFKTPSLFALENFGEQTYKVTTNASHRAFYAPGIQDIVYNLSLGKEYLFHHLDKEIQAETFGQASLIDFMDEEAHRFIDNNSNFKYSQDYIQFAGHMDNILAKDDIHLNLRSMALAHYTDQIAKIFSYVDSIIEIKDESDLSLVREEEIFIYGEDIPVTYDLQSTNSLLTSKKEKQQTEVEVLYHDQAVAKSNHPTL